MGMKGGKPRSARATSGQMTVELAVALPVLIAVTVIAVNAMAFFCDCAVFDRVACEAVRVYATAPAYGEDAGQACAMVEQAICQQLDEPNVSVSVWHGSTGADFDEYTMQLMYAPTLFGRGFRGEVFGVHLPLLTHTTRYVVDSYRPGVVI